MEEKCLLRFVAGPSSLNISSGLIHRAEFIYKLILGNDLLVFTDPQQLQHSGNIDFITIMFVYFIYYYT